MALVIALNRVSIKDISDVGGKVASLGEMLQHLSKDINVPPGFCLTAAAFKQFIRLNQLEDKIAAELHQLDINDIQKLQRSSRRIKGWVLRAEMPQNVEAAIVKHYQRLRQGRNISVAVRSSATCEDLPTASFAGLHNTIVHIGSVKTLLSSIKEVWASLYNERAIAYRQHHQFSEASSSMAIAVQLMVPCSQATSGIMFTVDTESGFDKVVSINAVYGLGEGIVSGKINPDEYSVFKPSLTKNKVAILQKKRGDIAQKMVLLQGKIKLSRVSQKQREQYCLTDQQIEDLARQAVVIEKHYGKAMDIEWAQDPRDKKMYIVQARPETVASQAQAATVVQYKLVGKAPLLCSGRSVGSKIGMGNASVIRSLSEMHNFKPGSVLVTDNTDPDWEPIMKQASAIVTNRGGRTCHAAIIARELGVPAVVGTNNATKLIQNNVSVTVSCAEGEVGKVYPGMLKFVKMETELKRLPKLPVELSMNLGNPEKAFAYHALPNAGVGLARLEFIISTMIGVHPRALLDYKKLPMRLKKEIDQKMLGYKQPTQFYIDKLAQGMATIAAAFYPKQVIFRFSDFKSNEYANLLGGELFEPIEENPMLGYRGAARYVHPQFQDCFALECAALKFVREDMGLSNAQAMIPFARTVQEVKAVVDLMAEKGLQRGKRGLKVFLMCEVPSNALLADEFLQHCDGFSIGSNDLTQLTLGVDRDSEIIAPVFDERDPAVKALLQKAIKACLNRKKYVGICGQGPSDYPEFADWLVKQGIKSMSLNPDSIVSTWLYLAKA